MAQFHPKKQTQLEEKLNKSNPSSDNSHLFLYTSLFIGVVLIISFLLFPYFFLGFYYTDASSVDDTDLALADRQIPQEENAFYIFQQLDKEDVEISTYFDGEYLRDYIDGNATSSEKIDHLLASTTAVRATFESAASSTGFQDPDFSKKEYDTTEIPLMDLTKIRKLGRIYTADVQSQLRNGDQEGAVKGALTLMQVGQMMMKTQAPPMYFLVGKEVYQNGLSVLEGVSASAVSDEIRSRVASQVQSIDVSGLASGLKVSYQFSKAGIERAKKEGISRGGPAANLPDLFFIPDSFAQNDFYFQKNKTLSYIADHYRGYISMLDSGCESSYSQQEMIEQVRPPESPFKLWFTPNAAGRTMLTNRLSSAGGMVEGACSLQQEVSNVGSEWQTDEV